MTIERHLVYEAPSQDTTEVTFAWTDDNGDQVASNIFASAPGKPETWKLAIGRNTRIRWVEYRTKQSK